MKKCRKRKKISLKRIFKGFTLVELLAVIVILAIIMIIAIPSVLGTLETARRKNFMEYAVQTYTKFQTKWIEDKDLGGLKIPSDSWNIYYTLDDLGLSSTGTYYGLFEIVTPHSDLPVVMNYEHYRTLDSKTYIQFFLFDEGTNYALSFFGELGSEFPSEITDYPFFKTDAESEAYRSEHGFYPDYYIENELFLNRETMISQISSMIAANNASSSKYKIYKAADLK